MDRLADSSTIRQLTDFAAYMGLHLPEILPPRLMQEVERAQSSDSIPAHVTPDVLQLCAIASNRSDFGVSFAAWLNPHRFGPLCLLWDHCSTLEEAMRVTRQYLPYENRALGMEIVASEQEVAIVHQLLVPVGFGGTQFLEAALANAVRIIRIVRGVEWRPIRIEFEHCCLGDERLKHHFFGCPLEYDQDRYAVICRPRDMTEPSPNSNPRMLLFLEEHVRKANRKWPADFCLQVEQLVMSKLAGGHANLPDIAACLAVSQRTLQRRLAEHQTDFASIVEAVRCRRVEEYFQRDDVLNLSQLTFFLGFSEASSASRFIKQKMGRTSRELRRTLAQSVRGSLHQS